MVGKVELASLRKDLHVNIKPLGDSFRHLYKLFSGPMRV